MKNYKDDFIQSIGNTPLIKLKAASEITGCNIYGKAEYLNPGGSVKDRAALALIRDAEQKKLIAKGTIVPTLQSVASETHRWALAKPSRVPYPNRGHHALPVT